ncbi:phage terminase large subunit [Shewanella avicenniae]|uniref:phage terminase large subunit n=1 Tax=Shewanella avicenniae TaxID=2814294 RepID=UPI001E47E601|nr:phage terminase large subunit [Shewanella avicenniae]
MTPAEEIELLMLLEAERRQQAIDNLDNYCRYIEIPSVPLKEDECPLGDKCDDPNCTMHETSTAFYPITVEPAEHHRLLNSKLMDVEAGRIKRLMVMMPPGSAKSTYGTVTFPTWYMGKHPNENIICTSYGSSLAKKFGRKCRAITSSKGYNELFGVYLNADNRAVDDWSISNGATYMCGGILSGITGNRANGLVIDDPVKGREDADSPTIREKTWEAYLNDLRTRLKPNGWIIIIQTRWHEDDLSGRILPKDWNGESGWITSRDGEDWYVLCLQAQCETDTDPLGRKRGEWLWTEWFTPEHWAREKRVQGSRNWESLYQQRPKPLDGSLIKRAWPKRYGTPPSEFSRVVISLDTAYKPEQHNDPSVATIWGELDENHYLLHVWRDRVEYPSLKRILASLYMQWRPDAVLIEDKASGQSLIQECREGIKLEGFPKPIRMPVIAIDPQGVNKLDRLIAVSPMIEAGQFWLPVAAPWLPDYESELFGFPLSANDDQVDSTSQYLKWARMHGMNIVYASLNQQKRAEDKPTRQSFAISNRSRSKYRGY